MAATLYCPKLQYYIGDESYRRGETFIRDALTQSSALLSTTAMATNRNNNNRNNSKHYNNQQQSLFSIFL